MRPRGRTSRSVAGVPEVSGAAPQTLAEIPPSRIAGCGLAALALVIGVWYASFGLSLFINLSLATHRWIVASGDPDFWLDADTFRAAGAVMALLAFGLGIFTIRAAGHTFISRYEPPTSLAAADGPGGRRQRAARAGRAHRRGADALAGRFLCRRLRDLCGALGHRQAAGRESSRVDSPILQPPSVRIPPTLGANFARARILRFTDA